MPDGQARHWPRSWRKRRCAAAGRSSSSAADAGEEQVRNVKVRQNFARSMSLADAMSSDNILAYEMNGAPLPQPNGFPLRLIAPAGTESPTLNGSTASRCRTPRSWAASGSGLRDPAGGAARRQDGWASRPPLGGPCSSRRRPRSPGKAVSTALLGWPGAHPSPKWRSRSMMVRGWRPRIDRSEEADHAWRIWSLDWERPSPGEHRITSGRWISREMFNRRWTTR